MLVCIYFESFSITFMWNKLFDVCSVRVSNVYLECITLFLLSICLREYGMFLDKILHFVWSFSPFVELYNHINIECIIKHCSVIWRSPPPFVSVCPNRRPTRPFLLVCLVVCTQGWLERKYIVGGRGSEHILPNERKLMKLPNEPNIYIYIFGKYILILF